jgi:hypothetical protein
LCGHVILISLYELPDPGAHGNQAGATLTPPARCIEGETIFRDARNELESQMNAPNNMDKMRLFDRKDYS